MGRDKKPAPAAAPTPTAPREVMTNAITQQQDRYNQQQGPLVNAMAENYGRATEQNFGDYTDIMNQYRGIASGQGTDYSVGGGGGGGGGGGYDVFGVDPERVSAERVSVRGLSPLERVTAQKMNPSAYAPVGTQTAGARSTGPIERVAAKDPFASYGGFQEFSQTGGYSPADIQAMRARGVAPIRAAYGNAERNVNQQRSLQGGYSPNAVAAQAKMAREQGQGMADASTNVEAQLAQMKQAGRLQGLTGMSGIEGQRLNAQMQGDIFNAGQYNQNEQFNVGNELQSSMFNAGQGNENARFNAGQQFAGNQFDISNQMNADQFNSGQAFAGQQFDIGNELQAGMANASNSLDAGKFNAGLNFQGQTYNADAQTRAQSANNAASAARASANAAGAAQSTNDRLRALSGMTGLYSATPGLSNMFGGQVAGMVGQGGSMNQGFLNELGNAQQSPDAYSQTMGRINQGMNLVGTGANIAAGFMGPGGSGGARTQPVPTAIGARGSQSPFQAPGYQQGYQMPQPPPYYDPNEPDWGD